MSDLAIVDDVEKNYRRLSPREKVNAQSWLRTASAQLRDEIVGLDAKIVADPSFADLVKGVVAMAVIRVLRGGDPNDPSSTVDLFFTNRELARLNGNSGSSSLAPAGSFPDYVPLPVF